MSIQEIELVITIVDDTMYIGFQFFTDTMLYVGLGYFGAYNINETISAACHQYIIHLVA